MSDWVCISTVGGGGQCVVKTPPGTCMGGARGTLRVKCDGGGILLLTKMSLLCCFYFSFDI